MIKAADSFRSSPVDPRTRLIIIILISSMAVALNHIIMLGMLLAISFLVLVMFRIDIKSLYFRIKGLIATVLLIAIIQSLFNKGGEPLVLLGGIRLVTTEGLMLASEFLMRMIIIFASAGILVSCGSRNIIQGLVQMRLPYEIAFMAALGLRFLPTFREEFTDAITAIQLRGIDLKALRFRQKLQVYAGLIQPVVAGALIRSRALSMSIEMRGFRSRPNRTSYRVLRFRLQDYLIMTFAVSMTMVLSTFYFLILNA
jgi:energy-coupling factor transport system permease protein